MNFLRTVLCLGLLCGPLSAVAATAADNAAAREAFQRAWQRVTAGEPDLPDPPALRRYLIYPYLQAARLQRDLQGDDPPDAAVAAFLHAHAGEPVARALRRVWLASLAARQRWSAFLDHYRAEQAGASLRCQAFAARIALGRTDPALVDAVQRAYVAAATAPDDCKPAFDWLRNTKRMTADMIETRARLALQAGLADAAEQLAAELPATRAGPIRQWAALIADPSAALHELIADPQRPVEDAALQDGFFRLARKDPQSAETLYPQLLAVRDPQSPLRDQLTRALALGLAWSRLPQALEYFDRFQPTADDQQALEWRVRAALWNGAWHRAQRWLRQMPAALRDQPAWTYWRGRVADHLGDRQRAAELYRRLLASGGYYPLLAALRLGEGYLPQSQPLPDQPALRRQLLGLPGVQRAHELFAVELEPQAAVEWNTALAQTAPDARLQAIRLARRWGWYKQAVITAADQGVFDDYPLLFPRPYPRAMAAATRASRLASDWLYAVLRAESLYDPRAVSGADALGLMQLRLATARAVARRHHLPPPADAQALFDPTENLTLGALHLRELADAFDGRFILALAAYNAGRNAARRWLPSRPTAADVWIDNVPYDETRGYIQRVLWHVAVFGWRRNHRPQTIADLLPPVAPVNAASSPSIAAGSASR